MAFKLKRYDLFHDRYEGNYIAESNCGDYVNYWDVVDLIEFLNDLRAECEEEDGESDPHLQGIKYLINEMQNRYL